MFYFVYQTTNVQNKMIYVGVHSTLNLEDGYIGSGIRLNYAIKKYGKENFLKEILVFFECLEDAYKLEGLIVDKEFILRKDTYNIKVGGLGGWYHINQFLPEDRPNIISLKQKVKDSTLEIGGTKNWSQDSYNRVVDQARINSENNRLTGKCMVKGSKHTKETRIKLSIKSSGSNNSNFGKKWFVLVGALDASQRKSYIPGSEPLGYITCEEWNRNKLKGTGNTFGKGWYNNGTVSKLFNKDEVPESFTKGRLQPNKVSQKI